MKLRTFAALALAPVAVGCGVDAPPASREDGRAPVAAETLVAAAAPLAVPIEATGTVEPWARVTPGTKILGRIASVPVREGQRVRRGQVLAALERRDLEAAVDQSRAGIAVAEATLDNARAQHERMEALHARGSATLKSLEDATTARRVAEAALERARADLAAAEVTLSYAEIASPVDGWLADKGVETGDMAAPGQPLFAIEDLSRVKVLVRLPESDAVRLEPGAPAAIRVDALDESFDARIDRILPAGDAASRTYDAQLVLENPGGRLRSGMFVRAAFDGGSRPALLVPRTALVHRGQLDGLFVVDADGRARLRWVRAGRVAGDRVEVLSGLEAGERYVAAPPAGLADGVPLAER